VRGIKDNSKEKIDELIIQIDNNNIKLEKLYQSAGELGIQNVTIVEENKSIKSKSLELIDINQNIENIDNLLKDLQKSYTRISEISEREKNIGEEYSDIEKNNNSLFPSVGKAAYIQWKKNPVENLNKIMESTAVIDNKILQIDNEIFKMDNTIVSRAIIKKFRDKGRMIFIKNKKRSFLNSLNHGYKRVGEKIYKNHKDFFKNINNESVETILTNVQLMDKLDKEIQSLKDENKKLEKHLKTKFKSGKKQKAEDRINSERDDLLLEKAKRFYDIGLIMYKEQLDCNNKSIVTAFKEINKLSDKNLKLKKEKDKNKAYQEIKKLEDEVIDIKNNIKDIQLTIDNCNNDISEFNKEMKRANSEIRKLKKITDEKIIDNSK